MEPELELELELDREVELEAELLPISRRKVIEGFDGR